MMTKKLTIIVCAVLCSYILNAQPYPTYELIKLIDELTIKYDNYNKYYTSIDLTENGIERRIGDFRVEFSPDQNRGVEYYNNELLRQNWLGGNIINGYIYMVGTKSDSKYKYLFYNRGTGSVLYCLRDTPIPDMDILKGDALSSSMKGDGVYYSYYSYYSDKKGLAGMPLNSRIALFQGRHVYYLNQSDLSLEEDDVPLEKYSASEALSKKAAQHKSEAELNCNISVKKYLTDREEEKITKPEKIAEERALMERKLAEERKFLKEANAKLKRENLAEYLVKYATGGHFMTWERVTYGDINEYTYYYTNDKNQLMKATFWAYPPDKKSSEKLDEDTYLSEDDLKKKRNILITNTATGDTVYSYEIEEEKQRLERQRQAEAEKAAAERKARAKRAALAKKYGAKYVNAALDGKLMIGMPLALVKETTDWFSVAVDVQYSKSSYYYVYRKKYTYLGSFSLKYAYIGVTRGRISYIRYCD